MQAVYMIRNKINGKMYIGQTINFYNRMQQHKRSAYNQNSDLYNYPLYVDMREFGLDNFEFSILEECTTQEELYEKEKYYIEYYDTIVDHGKGYNMMYGGLHGKPSQVVFEQLPLFKSGEENISYGKYNYDAFASKRVLNATTNTVYGSLRDCAIQEYGDIRYVKPISNVCNPNSNKFTYHGNTYYILDDFGNPILKQTQPIKNNNKGVHVIEKNRNFWFDSINDASSYFELSSGFIRDRIYNRIKNDKYSDRYCFEIYDN